MLGLDDVHTLAHAVEDVLEDVRERGEFPVGLADTLLRAVDVLRRELTGDAEGAPDLIEELARRPGPGAGRAEERSDLAEEPATPLERRTIRVPAEKIDLLLDLVGESVLHRRRLEHVLGEELARRDEGVLDELDQGERLLDDLKEAAIGMRTLPLSSITGPMPRAVRDLALAAGKQAELEIAGGGTELDRVILESLSEPLVHLLRNAVAHGIEEPDERVAAGKDAAGRIALRAEQLGGSVEIVVVDDGRGVSTETLAEARRIGSLTDVLTRPGFSTAGEVSELSGRGVGLDAVKRHVESFGGTLEVRSEPGEGTEVAMLLPLTLALLEVLLVERGGNVFGIPLANIEEAVSVTDDRSSEERPPLEVRGRALPLSDLADVIGAAGDALPSARRRSSSPREDARSRSSATRCSGRTKSSSSRSDPCSRPSPATSAGRSSATGASGCCSIRRRSSEPRRPRSTAAIARSHRPAARRRKYSSSRTRPRSASSSAASSSPPAIASRPRATDGRDSSASSPMTRSSSCSRISRCRSSTAST